MPSNENAMAALAAIESDRSKILGIRVGERAVEPIGLYIPKADAKAVPELSFQVPNPASTYLAVSLDVDAPFPGWGFLGPILHWIQPGLKLSSEGGKFLLKATEPFVANYIPPAPPPGSSPHRYCVFLYEQPEGFDGKKHAPPNGENLGNVARMWYSLDNWEKEVNLGPIIAANYFTSN